MSEILDKKRISYNIDALKNNIRNIEVTYNIIKHQIKYDGFTIISNNSEWYLVKTKLTSSHCPDQGIYNIYKELGQHKTEANLLKHYLEKRM